MDCPLKLPATAFCCSVAFKCQAYEGQTVSGHKKRHLALQGRVSRRDVVRWLVVVLVFDESVFEFVVHVRRPARYFFLSPPGYWVAPLGCSAWVDPPGSWFFTPGSCLLAIRVFPVSSSLFTCPQISSIVLVTVLPSSSLLLTMFSLRSCRFRALCLLRVFSFINFLDSDCAGQFRTYLFQYAKTCIPRCHFCRMRLNTPA